MTETGKSGSDVSREKERRFFYLVGRIVIETQTIEDYLQEIFAHALPLDRPVSDAIFASAFGLPKRIALITAALLARSPEAQLRWEELAARISAVSGERNGVAHSRPTYVGATVVISMSKEGEAIDAREEGESHWRTEKIEKKGVKTYLEGDLKRIARAAYDLTGDLIQFGSDLKTEKSQSPN